MLSNVKVFLEIEKTSYEAFPLVKLIQLFRWLLPYSKVWKVPRAARGRFLAHYYQQDPVLV